jgi:DNA end-binding protein Ku
LKALEEGSGQTIDIVSFIPERSVDPIYFDKAYYLTPDKSAAKPYTLFLRAMQESRRCALAKWAWRSKKYVVQIRPGEGSLVLQQLLYADEVRALSDFDSALAEVSDAEVQLAMRLIAQISQDSYDPTLFVDEEKQRILSAVEQKIAGKEIVARRHAEASATSGNVVDLMEALRASLQNQRMPDPAALPIDLSPSMSVGGCENMPTYRSLPERGIAPTRAPAVLHCSSAPCTRSRFNDQWAGADST